MFKSLMLVIVFAAFMTGCSGSKAAEQKGFVEGCATMAHDIIDPSGQQINDAKLAEYCKALAQRALAK
jgi:hypothetical protein